MEQEETLGVTDDDDDEGGDTSQPQADEEMEISGDSAAAVDAGTGGGEVGLATYRYRRMK